MASNIGRFIPNRTPLQLNNTVTIQCHFIMKYVTEINDFKVMCNRTFLGEYIIRTRRGWFNSVKTNPVSIKSYKIIVNELFLRDCWMFTDELMIEVVDLHPIVLLLLRMTFLLLLLLLFRSRCGSAF